MMSRAFLLMILCLVTTAASAQLQQIWITDGGLNVPESVKFSEENECIFVSNICGKPADKDGVGFISKLSSDGKVVDLEWVSGLDAPKGIAVNGNLLYVSNINELVVIDINEAKIIKRISQPEAKFLNDVTITRNNDVLVSDSGGSCIYVLNNDQLDIWLEGEMLRGVNGLFAEDNYVLVGTSTSILKVDVKSKSNVVFVETSGTADGIEADGNGGYYYSYWRGELYHVVPPQKPVNLFNTSENNVQSADIGFNPQTGEVLVPTFFSNQIVAYTKN